MIVIGHNDLGYPIIEYMLCILGGALCGCTVMLLYYKGKQNDNIS